jgi:hypothetical protein
MHPIDKIGDLKPLLSTPSIPYYKKKKLLRKVKYYNLNRICIDKSTAGLTNTCNVLMNVHIGRVSALKIKHTALSTSCQNFKF